MGLHYRRHSRKESTWGSHRQRQQSGLERITSCGLPYDYYWIGTCYFVLVTCESHTSRRAFYLNSKVCSYYIRCTFDSMAKSLEVFIEKLRGSSRTSHPDSLCMLLCGINTGSKQNYPRNTEGRMKIASAIRFSVSSCAARSAWACLRLSLCSASMLPITAVT